MSDFLAGHDCQTARFVGLAGLKNGDLLIAAEAARFDVLLTEGSSLGSENIVSEVLQET
jgi:hypothetical protein